MALQGEDGRAEPGGRKVSAVAELVGEDCCGLVEVEGAAGGLGVAGWCRCREVQVEVKVD